MPSKPILVFDATILANGNTKSGGRSGIFWGWWNLFKEVIKWDHLWGGVYCHSFRYIELASFLKQQFPKRKFTFVNQPEMRFCTITCSKLRGAKERAKNNKQALRKNLFHLLSIVFRMGSMIEACFANWNKNLKDVSYFFSPMYEIPKPLQAHPHITKAIMLYDAMPALFPHFFPNGCPWWFELKDSLNTQDLYFTDSQSARQDFLKLCPHIPSEHITTAYISTNQPYRSETDPTRLKCVKEKYHIPADKSYIFSLCTMEQRKNIPFAIDAFIRFCEQNHVQDQIMVLGGSFQDKRLDKYKKSPYVKFIGYVDDEDLQLLYSAADAFVYPSLYEGFGMPILEAMSCGCPVICSNTSSMPEVIGDCGILIDPTQEQDLINAFTKMHTDGAFRQACRQKGLARAQQFSWEKCINVILNKMMKKEEHADSVK